GPPPGVDQLEVRVGGGDGRTGRGGGHASIVARRAPHVSGGPGRAPRPRRRGPVPPAPPVVVPGGGPLLASTGGGRCGVGESRATRRGGRPKGATRGVQVAGQPRGGGRRVACRHRRQPATDGAGHAARRRRPGGARRIDHRRPVG